MGDMKDKFKGYMKKVGNPFTSSSSGKFKGQGRVLGSSSSGQSNPILSRPGSQFSNPNPKPNPNPNPNPKPNPNAKSQSIASSKDSKPVSEKAAISDHSVRSSSEIPGPLDRKENHANVDGFDPYGSLITSGKRNKNGFSLNVFECPVCNCGFSSEEEVSSHIESCIANSSKGDVNGVDSTLLDETDERVELRNKVEDCVGTYLSGKPSEGSLEVVLRLLRNIVKEPENSKFRKIRMSNPKIREAIGEVAGAIELIECVGFELKEEEGEMWALMDTPSEENIRLLQIAVSSLEPQKNIELSTSSVPEKIDEQAQGEKVGPVEPEVIDRQIKVFFSVPESKAAKIELPESFYKLSLEEVRREAELRKKKIAESQLLIPKSYKEKQAQASRKRYTRTIIRVQFPDGVVLQGVFAPKEPTSVLYEFVNSALKQQGLEFELFHPLPVKRRVIPCFPAPGERETSLEDEDLVPSALVKFKPFETDSMVFTGLRNELLELSEPLT